MIYTKIDFDGTNNEVIKKTIMIKNAFLKNITNSNNTGLKYYISNPTEKANYFSHLYFRNMVFCEDETQVTAQSNRQCGSAG